MADAAGRANILVFCCDQLRLDLLGCGGGRLVRTPHLDALAAEVPAGDGPCPAWEGS